MDLYLFWVLTSTLSWKVKCISMRPLTQPPGFELDCGKLSNGLMDDVGVCEKGR